MALRDVVEREMYLSPPRRDGKRLRFTFAKAIDDTGAPVAWHTVSLVGPAPRDEVKISIRGSELRAFVAAVAKTVAGSTPRSTEGGSETTTPAAQRELLPHEIYDRRAGRDLR